MNSSWIHIDLHIHSKKSNDVVPNDYTGEAYTADDLISKLKSVGAEKSIFSITDHNCIDVGFYNSIFTRIDSDEYKNHYGCLVGTELSMFDDLIHDDIFHSLCFFSGRETQKYEDALDELYNSVALKKRNERVNMPDISKLFNVFSSKGIKEFILIPHFNNKNRGIAGDRAIEHLNKLCFNAYEDSNNIKNISNSLKVYLDNGYDNFPFVAFSDCHNISHYPMSSSDLEDVGNISHIMGSVLFPFYSVKTSLEEPRLRLNISGVEGMRKTLASEGAVTHFVSDDDEKISLSSYQNTIIGPFGSGKSLLFTKIIYGADSLRINNNYKHLHESASKFGLVINNTKVNSINEAINSGLVDKKYILKQEEEFYYHNRISPEYMSELNDRLNLSFEELSSVKFELDSEKISLLFCSVNSSLSESSNLYKFNYERALRDTSGYRVLDDSNVENFDTKLILLEGEEDIIDYVFGDFSIFSSDEKIALSNAICIKKDKQLFLNRLNTLNSSIHEVIKEKVVDYNKDSLITQDQDTKTLVTNNLRNLLEGFKNLSNAVKCIEENISKDIFDSISARDASVDFGSYVVECKYDLKDIEYKNLINYLFASSSSDDSLFKRFISLANGDIKLRGKKDKKELKIMIDKYEEIINKYFACDRLIYDIKKDGSSIISKSSGEKSNEFIKLFFDKIENDLEKDLKVVVLIDQPEDSIDNRNILINIVNRIKNIKLKYYNAQFIIVTHNANVAITADSEAIVVASPSIESFKYKVSSIEDVEFMDNVCEVLEGGRSALEARTVKYNINIIKKVSGADEH